jgi:ParB/RepB/Spo0J family partition protein
LTETLGTIYLCGRLVDGDQPSTRQEAVDMAHANPSGGTNNERNQAVAAAVAKKAVEDGALLSLGITEIGAHPEQPRTVINRERLKELKASLLKTKGVMTPIEVRPSTPNELKAEPQFPYRLIAGQRRLEAYRELHSEAQSADEKKQWATIRALVKVGIDEHEALERALIENIQREELLPLDEAEAYARIKRNRSFKNAKEVAAAVGKKEDRVKDLLRLNEAPDFIKEALRTGLKVVRVEAAEEGTGSGETREKREVLRRLDITEALKFLALYEHYFEKHGGFSNRSAAQKATESTRNAIERAISDGWTSRKVDEYVKGIRAGRTSAPESKPQPLFKNDDKQLVLYWPRLLGATPEEKALARDALTNALAQMA